MITLQGTKLSHEGETSRQESALVSLPDLGIRRVCHGMNTTTILYNLLFFSTFAFGLQSFFKL
jgi:hypothetical protein